MRPRTWIVAAAIAVPMVRTAGHGFGTIRGRVALPEGAKRLPRRYEVFVAEFAWHPGYEVDGKGRFEVRNVPEGTYHLVARGAFDDTATRHVRTVVVGDLGREALSAVPDIAQAVRDEEPFVRDAATQAIAKITGKALPYREGMTEEEVAAAARNLVEEVRGE